MASPIVDAHLDLASNVLGGRDYRLEIDEIRSAEHRTSEECTVSLPELRRAHVAIAFATIMVMPERWDATGVPIYQAPPSIDARAQIAVYESWQRDGLARIIRSRADLDVHLGLWARDDVLGLVLLMEGADPIDQPADLPEWWRAGIRIIGPAWSMTRYAGGTDRPGGLTSAGRDLVAQMAEIGIAMDLSHMADAAFGESLDVGTHAVLASHSNARSLVPTDRQLSDEMIVAIGSRGGVIGLNLYNEFIHPRWHHEGERPAVGLDDLRPHAEHIAGLIGWERVGIGSDLDGGLGLEETPVEIGTVADIEKICTIIPEAACVGVLGNNWIEWLRRVLPA
ncbi:MAG: peptidase M19 [Candidatus Nephthysia bennettiae]|uniref:Membrane dipeptidase n=1 Tax=Candidatus Nephthysia bennettiae TaxID=3127016 RepID=A0A934K4Z2_9BACT|nr:membrane dipeptidase [Candidatus Dormibacteraeota bacterium]PZR90994.1 MAG: peptidase M19 [Candidatus Dormibacteraeota bacterium]